MRNIIDIKLWGYPFALALITLVGLIWALLGEGFEDIIAGILLLIPIGVIVTYYYIKK